MTEDEEFKHLCDMQDRDAIEVRAMTLASKALVWVTIVLSVIAGLLFFSA